MRRLASRSASIAAGSKAGDWRIAMLSSTTTSGYSSRASDHAEPGRDGRRALPASAPAQVSRVEHRHAGHLLRARDVIPQVEHALEVAEGLRQAGHGLGLAGGLQRGGERLLRPPRRDPVLGQLAGARPVGGEGPGEALVHVLALSRQQRRVRRLGDEGVTEPVAPRGAVGDEQPVVDRLAQRLDDLLLAERHGGGQDRRRHLAPRGGGEADDRPRRRLQALEVREQRVLEQPGELGLVAQRRGDQLLGEERVALRAGADRLDQLGAQRAVALAGDERRELVPRERSELHRERNPAAPQPGGQPVHRVVLAHRVLPPRRDDEHAAVVDGVRQEGEEVERRPVGPVQVLEHQHDRRGGAETLERRAHRLEQVQLRRARVPVRGRGERRAGQQARQLLQPVEGGRAAQRPERLDEREVGQGGSDEVDAPSREHGRAAPARPLRQLAGQPRLADAGGAGDQCGRAVPGRRSVERLLEPRQLRRPADEPVAGGRHGHRGRLGAGAGAGEAWSRAGSWLRMRYCSSARPADGSIPSSSRSAARSSWKAASASACLPCRYSASISWRRGRSRSGWLATRALQLPGDVAMAAERELRVDPVLDGEQPELVEVCGRGRGERLRELTERGPAPERARGREALGRRGGVAVGQRLAALLAQPLEPQQVDGLRRDLEPVARRARLQRPARQDLAELRDVDVHHLHRRGGHALAPQRVDERIDRHGPVRLEQQAGEQRALALPAGGHGLAAVHDLQRAEEPVLRPVVRELHGRMPRREPRRAPSPAPHCSAS